MLPIPTLGTAVFSVDLPDSSVDALAATHRLALRQLAMRMLPDKDALDFAAPGTALDIKAALLRTVDNRLWRWHKNTVSACSRHENLFHASQLNRVFLPRYWGAIDIGSYLLVRAIQTRDLLRRRW